MNATLNELQETRDTRTGRRIRQFTAGGGHSYPLYYFTPSVTLDGRFIVIHRIRDGWLNLWRLDLRDGTMVQLTEGTTSDATWAIWGGKGVRGVCDHLSSLNRVTREVWYFDGSSLFATHLDSLQRRQVLEMGYRVCISQNDFSPDGRWFVFIHTDRQRYQEALRRQTWAKHEAWRRTVPVTVAVIDTATGEYRVVAEAPLHLHHAVFIDNETFLVNGTRDGGGMWRMGIDGRDFGVMRPADERGTVCHQSVTASGIWYEAVDDKWPHEKNWIGCYDLSSATWREFPVPGKGGYVHIGHDPAGKEVFYEIAGEAHDLVRVHEPFDEHRRRFELICNLSPYPAQGGGQHSHAHPFLGPQRDWLYHTRVVNGVSQVAAVEFQ